MPTNLRPHRWLIYLPALVLVILGFAAWQTARTGTRTPASDPPRGQNIDMAVLPAFTNALPRAIGVRLYEGLPHQAWERELLRKELRTKRIQEIQEFPFYAEALIPKAAAAARLTTVSLGCDAFLAWRGHKKCGGYHPD
jgi:hypothetical protein